MACRNTVDGVLYMVLPTAPGLFRQRPFQPAHCESRPYKDGMLSNRVALLFWITFVHLAGIYLFTRGFLLTRLAFSEVTTCPNQQCTLQPTYKRAVFLIIDALRFDFISPDPPIPASPYYHDILTLPRELTATYPTRSFLFNAYSDPPTVTHQRIQGLTTGSLPTFVERGSNFGGVSIMEDSILKQLRLSERKVAFMGDDTWLPMFPDSFKANMTFPYGPIDDTDLHTIDEGVIRHLIPLLEDPSKPFDFLLGHFCGVDHIGHVVGPNHPIMKAKLEQMNTFLRQVVDLLDDETLLVVIGDHGMNDSGDHGGDGVLETSSALWVYSKQPVISRSDLSPLSSLLRYTTFPGASVPHRAVEQIDILPTLSLLLGLPIPYNNLGTVIPELLLRDSKGDILGRALEINAGQIKSYMDTYRSSSSGGELSEFWNMLETAWAAMEGASLSTEAKLMALFSFNRMSLAACRSIWAQFNPLLICLGLIVLAVGLMATCSVFSGLSEAEDHWDKWLSMQLSQCLRGVTVGAIIGICVYLSLASSLSSIDALDCILFATSLLSSLVIIISSTPNITFDTLRSTPIPLVLHTLAFFSNSFTIWEDHVVHFILLSSTIPHLLTGFTAPASCLRNRILVCREEQHPYCHVTFYISSSLPHRPPYPSLILAIPIALGIPYVIQRFLRITASNAGIAHTSLYFVLLPSLLAGSLYWIIEWMETTGVLRHEWVPFLRIWRTCMARSAFGIGIVGCGTFWWTLPICLDIDWMEANRGEKRRISMVKSASKFGSSYLMFWCISLSIVYATMQLTGQLILFLAIIALLAWLEVVDSVRDVRRMDAAFKAASPLTMLHADVLSGNSPPVHFGDVVPLALLSIHLFYATGHQSTLSSIQWESATLLTSAFTHPTSSITVFLNSFGPFFLMGLASPLVALWNRAPVPSSSSTEKNGSAKPDDVAKLDDHIKKQSTLAAVGYMAYSAALLFGTAMSAAMFRRHLNAWKVFSPRFMVGVMGVVAGDAAVLFGIGVGIGRINGNMLN